MPLSQSSIVAIASWVLLPFVAGLFEQCNHVVELQAGNQIYVNSPYYPQRYPAGTSCRYTLQAPLDHQLQLTCRIQLDSPATATRCVNEVFYFNREGSELLSGSEYFCGAGTVERRSFLNRAVISYISTLNYRRNLPGVERTATTATTTTTTTASTRTAPPPFAVAAVGGGGVRSALAYLLELLSKKLVPTTAANVTDDVLPEITWRHSIPGPPKSSRIVVAASSDGGAGGGRFSCLVEVIEPQCECGWSMSLKIAAGGASTAGVNEFPSMAGVLSVRQNKIFCGAAIIHHRYLLTAAHCFSAPETNRSELVRVVVGEHDISTVSESLYTRTYDIERILVHEQFRALATSVRHDIALLRTRASIEWNRGVGPACLPFRSVTGTDGGRKAPLVGQRLDAAGWGTTSFGGPQSQVLLRTTLDVIAEGECRRVVKPLPAGTFCTYTPGRDTCQYDSGGALYLRHEGLLFAVGIVSYGFACAAQQPSVNTKVGAYLRWIKAKTPEVTYCIK